MHSHIRLTVISATLSYTLCSHICHAQSYTLLSHICLTVIYAMQSYTLCSHIRYAVIYATHVLFTVLAQ